MFFFFFFFLSPSCVPSPHVQAAANLSPPQPQNPAPHTRISHLPPFHLSFNSGRADLIHPPLPTSAHLPPLPLWPPLLAAALLLQHVSGRRGERRGPEDEEADVGQRRLQRLPPVRRVAVLGEAAVWGGGAGGWMKQGWTGSESTDRPTDGWMDGKGVDDPRRWAGLGLLASSQH